VTQPEVSVVVPVHNAMPYLVTCLSSAMEQSIGRSRVEVIAVDDGATDGSGEQLDILARYWDNLRVVHQNNSGGPSRPRNVGLSHATGRFVFFLDADDYLGPEALERMVDLADAQQADVVACRRKGVGGRKEHGPAVVKMRHSGLAADVFDTAVRRSPLLQDWTPILVASADCKNMYRIAFLTRLNLRFQEDIHFGEDYLFGGACVKHGKVVMVDDYDCYYDRLRDDGRNGTTLYGASEMHLDAVERSLRLREVFDEPLWRREQSLRDGLMDLTQFVFNERFPQREPEIRARMMDSAKQLLTTWLSKRASARMPAIDRVKVALIERGREAELCELIHAAAAGERAKDVVRDGQVYAGYRYFQDPAVGVPDECYDVTGELQVRHHLAGMAFDGARLRLTGHAYIEHVDTVDVATEFVLRDKLGRAEHRWPVTVVATPGLDEQVGQGRYQYGTAGFEIELDLADLGDGQPLAPGTWNAFLSVRSQGVCKEVPVGGHRDASIDGPALSQVPVPVPAGSPGTGTISAAFTSYGTLTLDARPAG
jgi:poly(ribitol-phosphate) beta-N-acetylglucosaminyltransferase